MSQTSRSSKFQKFENSKSSKIPEVRKFRKFENFKKMGNSSLQVPGIHQRLRSYKFSLHFKYFMRGDQVSVSSRIWESRLVVCPLLIKVKVFDSVRLLEPLSMHIDLKSVF